MMEFNTTAEIVIPTELIDQVIGQEDAVEVMKLAAAQKRFVLLVGEPGTGKSLLGQAMAALLPRTGLEDILVVPNPEEKNVPKILVCSAGQAESLVKQQKSLRQKKELSLNFTLILVGLFTLFSSVYFSLLKDNFLYAGLGLVVTVLLFIARRSLRAQGKTYVPKMLVSHTENSKAPFVDATGSMAGSLFGDVRHDPFQSGGVETPPHELIEAGAIHRAHKGVLYIDEVGTLSIESQQILLTAIQDKKLAITGRSIGSSGAMVRTYPVPCDFHLLLAGNLLDIEKMHPALRSRIRGYGYEIHTDDKMEDSLENRNKLARFVAQEVAKDGKIPHFTRQAVLEIIEEAKRRSGSGDKLTLRLRELGGLIRAAGDIAKRENHPFVEISHIKQAKSLVKRLEIQIVEHQLKNQEIINLKEKEHFKTGVAYSMGTLSEGCGALLKVLAVTSDPRQQDKGDLFVSGKYEKEVKSLAICLEAFLKKEYQRSLYEKNTYVQILEAGEIKMHDWGTALVMAILSSYFNKPLSQDLLLLGGFNLEGELLATTDINVKVEAAMTWGFKNVIVPHENRNDIVLDAEEKAALKIVPLKGLKNLLSHAVAFEENRDKIIEVENFRRKEN